MNNDDSQARGEILAITAVLHALISDIKTSDPARARAILDAAEDEVHHRADGDYAAATVAITTIRDRVISLKE